MIHARRLPACVADRVVDDPEIVEGYLSDASGYPPGRASGVARVRSEAEAATLLREGTGPVLPQAARSSLTGGAIPQGELVLSVEGLTELGPIRRSAGEAWRTAGAGVRLDRLQADLDGRGLYYPPVPTYQQALLGGSVATNAGGAATFKYGVTRAWVRGLRVLLHNGDLLVLERGECEADRGGNFELRLSDGALLQVPAPSYTLPDLSKISAGYHAADRLDLIDLFVGSEGTLGLITAVTVNLVQRPPAVLTALVALRRAGSAPELADTLRRTGASRRRDRDLRVPDIRAIEWIDAHGVEILRRHGEARRLRIPLAADIRALVLFEMELPRETDQAEVEDRLSLHLDRPGAGPDDALARMFAVLDEHVALDGLELALADNGPLCQAIGELREALPRRVNEILAQRRLRVGPVHKLGGDLIVPVDRLPEMIELCGRSMERRGLEHATWGHLGDGNLHPNALARNIEDMTAGVETLLELGTAAMRLGGCPLSEHGVGRSEIKQELLRRFLGEEAIRQMQAVKAALDPSGRFAPGVIFPPRRVS